MATFLLAPPPVEGPFAAAVLAVVTAFLPLDLFRLPDWLARPLLGERVDATYCLSEELEPTPKSFLVRELILALVYEL